MRKLTLLPLLLLLAACATTDQYGLEKERVLDCANEVEIRVGLQGPPTSFEGVDDRLMLNIEVANNSNRDIVVKVIRVEQSQPGNTGYRVDSGYGRFTQTILEGEDHLFEIGMTGRSTRSRQSRGLQEPVELVVTVSLENGDTYRCEFAVSGPVS